MKFFPVIRFIYNKLDLDSFQKTLLWLLKFRLFKIILKSNRWLYLRVEIFNLFKIILKSNKWLHLSKPFKKVDLSLSGPEFRSCFILFLDFLDHILGTQNFCEL